VKREKSGTKGARAFLPHSGLCGEIVAIVRTPTDRPGSKGAVDIGTARPFPLSGRADIVRVSSEVLCDSVGVGGGTARPFPLSRRVDVGTVSSEGSRDGVGVGAGAFVDFGGCRAVDEEAKESPAPVEAELCGMFGATSGSAMEATAAALAIAESITIGASVVGCLDVPSFPDDFAAGSVGLGCGVLGLSGTGVWLTVSSRSFKLLSAITISTGTAGLPIEVDVVGGVEATATFAEALGGPFSFRFFVLVVNSGVFPSSFSLRLFPERSVEGMAGSEPDTASVEGFAEVELGMVDSILGVSLRGPVFLFEDVGTNTVMLSPSIGGCSFLAGGRAEAEDFGAVIDTAWELSLTSIDPVVADCGVAAELLTVACRETLFDVGVLLTATPHSVLVGGTAFAPPGSMTGIFVLSPVLGVLEVVGAADV
jgi:hypothetical protein